MNILLRGVIRGRTVELDRDPGFEENRVVDVILRTRQLPGMSYPLDTNTIPQ